MLERAPLEERGGQTRYTEAYLRMKSENEVTDDFETAFRRERGRLPGSRASIDAMPGDRDAVAGRI